MNELICRSSDVREPCKYAAICPTKQQLLQHSNDLRGRRCVFYEMAEQETGYPGRPREEVVSS